MMPFRSGTRMKWQPQQFRPRPRRSANTIRQIPTLYRGEVEWSRYAIYVFTHHKAGTRQIAGILQNTKDIHGRKIIDIERTEDKRSSHPTLTPKCYGQDTIVIYHNADLTLTDGLDAECPNYLALHTIREALSLTASGFAYHQKTKNRDVIAGTGPKKLAHAKTLRDKLTVEAAAESLITLPVMARSYNHTKHDGRFLQVRYEHFKKDFDQTTRAVFEHLFGTDYPHIDQLVKAARHSDTSRWDQSRAASDPHVASTEERNQNMETLLSMLNRQNDVIMKVASFNQVLDYVNGHNLVRQLS
eukprot:gnl/TRDRNA2_/TRDRNA2_57600_c0_seq2.p1 gnl/TRDRNA2_/TRDRNA2_57600_c0~~gnl/TRDRNA2_/TRDRNA2_57600_c0_seq2.p1  ORF type:complete len:301 (+),score=22.91 gnl/TRDRNA2_/TRDRNA2_57600_c0_seq2:2-904(+)